MGNKQNKKEVELMGEGPLPELVTVPVAEIQQHNQLLIASATALSHLLAPSQGIVISLQGQLHIVYHDGGNINLTAVTSNDQLAPGSIVTVNTQPEQTEAVETDSERSTPGDTHNYDWKHNVQSQLAIVPNESTES